MQNPNFIARLQEPKRAIGSTGGTPPLLILLPIHGKGVKPYVGFGHLVTHSPQRS